MNVPILLGTMQLCFRRSVPVRFTCISVTDVCGEVFSSMSEESFRMGPALVLWEAVVTLIVHRTTVLDMRI